MRRILFLTCACALLVSCSGGAGSPGARFKAATAPEKARASAKPAVKSPAAVALPANLPPASMFIGPASWRTAPSRYCRTDACETLTPAKPASLAGPSGAPVLFALSAAPSSARLDVTVPGSATPTPVQLNPGTTMVWQPVLPNGIYPLTLTATYKETIVTWPFSLRIAPKSGR